MGLVKMAGGPAPPGMAGSGDLSILSTIAAPDPISQRKYEAMGLPDPVAFAALTALGAIPNPMAMLNKMMLAAQERIDRDAARLERPRGEPVAETGSPRPAPEPRLQLPPGMSFMEAFQDMQAQTKQEPRPGERPMVSSFGLIGGLSARLDRDAESTEARAKEAATQARLAMDRAKEAAQMNRDVDIARSAHVRGDAGAPRDIAKVFSAAGDDDSSQTKPLGTTLSSLLTGRPTTQDPFSATSAGTGVAPRHLCMGGLPRGTAESAVRLECARHGAVSSVIVEADGCTAYVTFAAPEMASRAASGLAGRTGLFGLPPEVGLQVRLLGEIPDSIRLAASLPPAPLEGGIAQEPVDPSELPEYLRPREDRKKNRSRSRRRKKSKSRKRRRSRSMVRWLDRSRSNSHTATGQYIRATGCSSTVRWWEKKKECSSSSSSSSRERRRKRRDAEAEAEKRRPKQVAVKGHWAQFMQNGQHYFYSLLSGQTMWERPSVFDAAPSRRPHEAAAEEARPPRITSCFL